MCPYFLSCQHLNLIVKMKKIRVWNFLTTSICYSVRGGGEWKIDTNRIFYDATCLNGLMRKAKGENKTYEWTYEIKHTNVKYLIGIVFLHWYCKKQTKTQTTYFEEYKPINPCSYCDDEENICKISSVE